MKKKKIFLQSLFALTRRFSTAEQTEGSVGSEISQRSEALEVRQIQREQSTHNFPLGQEAGTFTGKLSKLWYGEVGECRALEPCVVWPHSILPPGYQGDSHDAY